MAPLKLPDDEESYRLLCERGEQVPATWRRIESLNGLTYEHPCRGRLEVMVDRAALAHAGRVYAGSNALRGALRERGASTATLIEVTRLVGRHLSTDTLVWGFSGYATAGYPCDVEAHSLAELYRYLSQLRTKPVLVVDGGVSTGVLGLNGVIAKQHQITTLGFIPLQGLGAMAPRDHVVVWGDTYQDREILVGTLPDILICVGGGAGTRRECQAALSNGSVVLLLAPRNYGPSSLSETYQGFSEMTQAMSEHRLFVCGQDDSMRSCVDAALLAAFRARIGRPARISKVGQLLAV
jgi:predicted Rossmann-fold nucleotide-binding protein